MGDQNYTYRLASRGKIHLTPVEEHHLDKLNLRQLRLDHDSPPDRTALSEVNRRRVDIVAPVTSKSEALDNLGTIKPFLVPFLVSSRRSGSLIAARPESGKEHTTSSWLPEKSIPTWVGVDRLLARVRTSWPPERQPK